MTHPESQTDAGMAPPAGRGTAVVIGAGIAGLAAARVLAGRFARVIVADRDDLPDTPEPRRGVPQGHHSHVLLVAGQRALENLFPGLRAALTAAGAIEFDSGYDLHLFRLGAAWKPVRTGLPFVSLSRPLLEFTMRQMVLELPQVTFRPGTAVSALTGGGGRISGVVLDGTEVVDADLVVDASGRGSRSDRWLTGLGFPAPGVEEAKVSVGYVSRMYRRIPGDLPVQAAFVQPTPPAGKQIGAALRVENDRWLVSVGGWHGDYPAADEEGFHRHANGLPDPIIAELVGNAEALTDPVAFHFPSNRRRLFDQVRDVPAGYLAIGDAIATFNPLYGQGMTVAAQEAQALARVLDEHPAASADMVRAFYREAAAITYVPWQAAIGADFDYPETTGEAPAAAALFGRYSTQVQLAAQVSGTVRRTVLEVQHLLSPPTVLWAPGLVAEVARAARHAGESDQPAFGYGAHERPLWTEDDAHAERIRAALRSAGFPEFTGEQAGFAVEGGAPILIAGLDGRVAEYPDVIAAAGYKVEADPGDPLLIRAEPARSA